MAKQSAMKAVIAAVVGVLVLAACGGGSSTSKTSGNVPIAGTGTQTTTVPTTTTPATTTSGTTTTAPATTTSTTSGPPACRTADFALMFLGQEGATGHGELGFALRNTSGRECHTYGYPGVLFLDKSGKPLPTTPAHTTTDFFGTTTETELIVPAGATVSFRLGVNHNGSSPSACTTVYGLQVIAPDDTVTTSTKIAPPAYECGGQVTVSPLQPATTAFSSP
jgi:hypothetical protein